MNSNQSSQQSSQQPPLITLCMIVKDEARMIERCLESARAVADQLVVVDTGSSDATPQLAAQAGAEVYHHPWRGDFSEARNHSLNYARGAWVLILDGDELLDPETASLIHELDLSDDAPERAYQFNIINFTTDRAIEAESGQISQVRLFKNRPYHRYGGLVHNQIQDQRDGFLLNGPRTPVRVLHYGYTPSVWSAQNKDDRIKLHERAVAEDPDSHFVRYNYGNHLKILGRHREALEQFMLGIAPLEVTGRSYACEVGSEMSSDTSSDTSSGELRAELAWSLSSCFLGAFCANQIREYDVALALTDEALDRAPHLLDARVRRAEALIGLTRYAEAAQVLEEGLSYREPLVMKGRALNFDAPYRLGRARFLMGERSAAAPAFASLLPQCDDVTVLTHLCLSALELEAPELWRYARARGAELAPDDPDWAVVDQALARGESYVSRLLSSHLLDIEQLPPVLTSPEWRDHLTRGLSELAPERASTLSELIITSHPEGLESTEALYLTLQDTTSGAVLSLVQGHMRAGAIPDPASTLYMFSERYAPRSRTLPAESAALLLAHFKSLTSQR